MSKVKILSTKKLSKKHKMKIKSEGLNYSEYDAISIEKVIFDIPKPYKNVVFSSLNAAKIVIKEVKWLKNSSIFCVGKSTEKLLLKNGIKCVKSAKNMQKLLIFIQKNSKNDDFLHFCGNLRLPIFSEKMKKWNKKFSELIVYQTKILKRKILYQPDAVLFFSPSAVKSYEAMNKMDDLICFCIGKTTSNSIKKKTKEIVHIKNPSIENLIIKTIKFFKE